MQTQLEADRAELNSRWRSAGWQSPSASLVWRSMQQWWRTRCMDRSVVQRLITFECQHARRGAVRRAREERVLQQERLPRLLVQHQVHVAARCARALHTRSERELHRTTATTRWFAATSSTCSTSCCNATSIYTTSQTCTYDQTCTTAIARVAQRAINANWPASARQQHHTSSFPTARRRRRSARKAKPAHAFWHALRAYKALRIPNLECTWFAASMLRGLLRLPG